MSTPSSQNKRNSNVTTPSRRRGVQSPAYARRIKRAVQEMGTYLALTTRGAVTKPSLAQLSALHGLNETSSWGSDDRRGRNGGNGNSASAAPLEVGRTSDILGKIGV